MLLYVSGMGTATVGYDTEFYKIELNLKMSVYRQTKDFKFSLYIYWISATQESVTGVRNRSTRIRNGDKIRRNKTYLVMLIPLEFMLHFWRDLGGF